MEPHVSSTLVTLLNRLRDWSDSQYNYLAGQAFAPTWSVPFNTNIMDPAAIGVNFVDTTLDPKLLESHQNRHPYWIAMQHNLQMNALASLERSFRGRHMQPVQAMYATAGRHLGQREIINAATGG